ncbi:MAG: GIY-YIG nuclease family protein [Ignavibacteria bacterium]|nr:GIY-YIG nuclease family protein [Ignavibacteria bacterium]
MEKYFTYIIQSLKDESFYIGYTSNLEKRINFHNSGLSKYTSGRSAKLVYFEEFEKNRMQ